MKQGWYEVGRNGKKHYFQNGEYGQGFVSFCGQRNPRGEREDSDPTIKTQDKCRFCYYKLKAEETTV